MKNMIKSPGLWIFLLGAMLSFYAGAWVPPTWTVETTTIDVHTDQQGKRYYINREKPQYLPEVIPASQAQLTPDLLAEINQRQGVPSVLSEVVFKEHRVEGTLQTLYEKHEVKRHWKFWSLLPALVAVLLCFVTREPVVSLFGGIVAGALLLSKYDITEEVLVFELATTNAAGILVLYLWLLGGLMGVWARTGAAQAFAELMTRRVVRGPRTARLVAWGLGIIFFQGGTVSTVLVGTTVKPIADKEKISHEELAYIVDSTASPVASQLAFNAWPGYVQAFIFVAGVPFLLTEADRISFFFSSVPLCFYAIFAILSTFLLSIDKLPFLSKQMQDAITRSRTTGMLDRPDARPLSAKELQASSVPEGYTPHIVEFFLPLGLLITIAIGTFITTGTPQVRWAFGGALLVAISLALLRGMRLDDVMGGVSEGMKGVVLGSLILLLAITIGGISSEAGGATYLVDLLGDTIPYWSLPVILQLLTITIAFSTGTSWGTYAVAFPLAMPLAWAVAQANGLEHPQLFMTICFAAVMDGSVFGDQCSPISDTTVLSAMCTGCDLMDHVKTQIPHASVAALLAAIGWTGITFLFV